MEGRGPEWPVGVLGAFHAVRHIGGVLGPPLRVDHDRQVAAVPDRVHRREEDEAVAAEQVTGVVLRRRQQHVDAGLLHQPVRAGGVEGDLRPVEDVRRCGHTGPSV